MGDARTYTGDLPDGVESVDALVVALMASVERVRRKYGCAVTRLSMATGVPVQTLMDEVDDAARASLAEEVSR